MGHFDEHSILSDQQHGFRIQRSCETPLAVFIDSIAQSLTEGTSVEIILLDFSKAFGKVPNEILLSKLGYYGVRGPTLQWIRDFDPYQPTKAGPSGWPPFINSRRGQSSGRCSFSPSSSALLFNFVNYFVWLRITDEGSVPKMRIWFKLYIKSDIKWYIHLSRSLFLYFIKINDLQKMTHSEARLFADDCLFYRPIKTTKDTKILQQDLPALEKLEKEWLMAFHPDKYVIIQVTTKRYH